MERSKLHGEAVKKIAWTCCGSAFPRWTSAASLRFVRVSERLAYGSSPLWLDASEVGLGKTKPT